MSCFKKGVRLAELGTAKSQTHCVGRRVRWKPCKGRNPCCSLSSACQNNPRQPGGVPVEEEKRSAGAAAGFGFCPCPQLQGQPTVSGCPPGPNEVATLLPAPTSPHVFPTRMQIPESCPGQVCVPPLEPVGHGQPRVEAFTDFTACLMGFCPCCKGAMGLLQAASSFTDFRKRPCTYDFVFGAILHVPSSP